MGATQNKILSYLMVLVAILLPFSSYAQTKGTNDNNSATVQEMSPEDLLLILKERVQNSEKYLSPIMPPLFLKLKKSPLAEGLTKGLNGEAVAPRLDESKFEILQTPSQDKDFLDVQLRDKETGLTYAFRRHSKEETRATAPDKLSSWAAFQGAVKKSSFVGSTIDAFGIPGRNGVKFPGQTYGIEAANFYVGLGANNVLNLIKDYSKDPMALERFAKSLEDPVTHISFFFFMAGNRYAASIFNDMLRNAKRSALTKTLGASAGFLSMAVGAIASDISSDLLAITKPCADAYFYQNKEENNTPEKRWDKCKAAWDMVVSSDTAARYLTSVGSILGAAAMSSVIQATYRDPKTRRFIHSPAGKLANKFIPIDGITVAYENFGKSGFSKGIKKLMGFGGRLGVKAFDLIIFLQADEFVRPYFYHAVENNVNAGLKLRNGLASTVKLADLATPSGSIDRSHLEYLESLNKRYEAFRQVIGYDFFASYYNWTEFLGNFVVMKNVSESFLESLAINIISAPELLKARFWDTYNPLIMDAPLYGVKPSENFPPQDKDPGFEFGSASQAIRVVEVLPLVNEGISDANTALSLAKRKYSSTAFIEEYLNGLNKVQKLILPLAKNALNDGFRVKIISQNEPAKETPYYHNEKEYAQLGEALREINKLYDKFFIRFSDNMPTSLITRYGMAPNSAQALQYQNLRTVRNSIKKIRDFLGDPTPLKRGEEAIFFLFNKEIKDNYPEFYDLFSEQGGPAETITYYAICGENIDTQNDNQRLDRRNTNLYSIADSIINAGAAAINGLTSLLPGNSKENNPYQISEHNRPVTKLFKSIRYGTGVTFFAPSIVQADKRNLALVCTGGENLQARFFRFTDSKKKTYDSFFSFLAQNIRPELLEIKEDPKKGQTLALNNWWSDNVEPKVALAYKEFGADYQYLLETVFKKVFQGSGSKLGMRHGSLGPLPAFKTVYLGEGNSEPSAIFEIAKKTPRGTYGNPSNLIQSYIDELDTYLFLFRKLYAQNLKKDQSYEQNIKSMIILEDYIRKLAAAILNDARTSVYPKLIDLPNGGIQAIYPEFADKSTEQKYAMLLVALTHFYNVFGLEDQSAEIAKGFGFLKDLTNRPDLDAPISRINLRLEHNSFLHQPFIEAREDFNSLLASKRLSLPAPLNLVRSGATQYDNLFTVNYLAGNNLYTLIEQIYANTNIIRLAKPNSTYTPAENRPRDNSKGGGVIH